MKESFYKSKKEKWFSGRRCCCVDIQMGKPLDFFSLKKDIIETFAQSLAKIRVSRKSLFRTASTVPVGKCPVCGASARKSRFKLAVYGAQYHECGNCSHHFVVNRPTPSALKDFYVKSAQYAATYTNKKTIDLRLKQVAIPKAKWAIEQYRKMYGCYPRSILDVGAGAGHFVHACRQMGLSAEGIEVSQPSRNFCRKHFGFDLIDIDFIDASKKMPKVEMITFWGVIEHVSNPVAFLKEAFKMVSKPRGIVVAEVPRWNCISTLFQSVFVDSIVRHLDPLGHINCFTDQSLRRAFELGGFAPVSAWYFGMDAYELMMQFAYLLKDKSVLKLFLKHINALQSLIDGARLSDEMVFAGRPRRA
ncbi:MAG: class I SAM-dependent methyltransferase [Candidatus Omnitrophota bacterium]